MEYEKPKCECGTDLVVRMDKIAEFEFAIKKDGRISKKGKRVTAFSQSNWGSLHCNKCGNIYEFNYDLIGQESFKFKREEQL
ncbi:hypothetical protein [Cohnella herbarum]|uniref:Uncharacterized protein n=1 Tax=Cohnella herbarum TaxID=2728023 RepID=A0A7Z2VRL0_9BACL|nr:hypothetical protein [Cohnella herbarum]QJD87886.1 hypothetical protein HH215_34980 [Cohnella herbarum]